jgi:DNA-binding FadR family transcriptional regulator
LNARFHLAVAEASGNAILLDLLRPLLEIGFTAMEEDFSEEVIEVIWSSHIGILTAIQERNVAAAEVAVNRHSMTGNIENHRLIERWRSAHDKKMMEGMTSAPTPALTRSK